MKRFILILMLLLNTSNIFTGCGCNSNTPTNSVSNISQSTAKQNTQVKPKKQKNNKKRLTNNLLKRLHQIKNSKSRAHTRHDLKTLKLIQEYLKNF